MSNACPHNIYRDMFSNLQTKLDISAIPGHLGLILFIYLLFTICMISETI